MSHLLDQKLVEWCLCNAPKAPTYIMRVLVLFSYYVDNHTRAILVAEHFLTKSTPRMMIIHAFVVIGCLCCITNTQPMTGRYINFT